MVISDILLKKEILFTNFQPKKIANGKI